MNLLAAEHFAAKWADECNLPSRGEEPSYTFKLSNLRRFILEIAWMATSEVDSKVTNSLSYAYDDLQAQRKNHDMDKEDC